MPAQRAGPWANLAMTGCPAELAKTQAMEMPLLAGSTSQRIEERSLVELVATCSWVELVTILAMWHVNSALVAVLRLFSPFAFFTLHADSGGVTAWRGSPWFFIGWQLALCGIAVLVALLRGAEGQVRTRIIRVLAITVAVALILLVLAATGGFTHAVTA